jgi:hypothetical protein
MKNIRLLAITNFWAFLIHLACSYLTRLNMINDVDVAEMSHRFPSLFTPADLTFTIWGLIYFLLFIFCIYHLITAFKYPLSHPANENTRKLGGMFILCNLATAAWLYCWTHAWLGFSLVLILLQLIILMSINIHLKIYNRDASTASKLFTQLPLSIWFGWITVAAIAGTDIYLLAMGWQGLHLTQQRWTVMLIAFTVLIGLCMVFGRRNIFYGLVIIWALCGIILRQTQAGAPAYREITLAAEAGLILMSIACLLQLGRNFSFRRHHPRRWHDAPLA